MAVDTPGSKSRCERISTQAAEGGNTAGEAGKNAGQSANRSPEEIQQLLRKRARVLAVEKTPEAGSENVQLVEFSLERESYVIESAWVDRIAFTENPTRLPCTPAFMRGVVNLRGEIIPVVDLMELFELPDRGSTGFGHVIVLQSGKMRFGVLVHAISGVRDVSITDIQPLPVTFSGRGRDYLKGITIGRLAVLDAEKLLTDKSLVIDEYVHG